MYDPWASKAEVNHEYGIEVMNDLPNKKYDAIVLTVAHDEYKELEIRNFQASDSVLYDVKGFFEKGMVDARL